MLYTVIRPFKNLDGSFLQVGDKIECENSRALVLRRNGLIGHIAEKKLFVRPENPPKETAVEKPVKRHYRKRNTVE